MDELKVTDIEIDKVMAPFADYDEDSGAVYFEEKPNWESKKNESQYDKCQEALVEFINDKMNDAYLKGREDFGKDTE